MLIRTLLFFYLFVINSNSSYCQSSDSWRQKASKIIEKKIASNFHFDDFDSIGTFVAIIKVKKSKSSEFEIVGDIPPHYKRKLDSILQGTRRSVEIKKNISLPILFVSPGVITDDSELTKIPKRRLVSIMRVMVDNKKDLLPTIIIFGVPAFRKY